MKRMIISSLGLFLALTVQAQGPTNNPDRPGNRYARDGSDHPWTAGLTISRSGIRRNTHAYKSCARKDRFKHSRYATALPNTKRPAIRGLHGFLDLEFVNGRTLDPIVRGVRRSL